MCSISVARFLLTTFALLLSVGAMGQDSSQSDQERYRRLIEKADSCFEEEAYGLAMEQYRKALEIHPEKEHPQKWIGKIESILSKDGGEKGKEHSEGEESEGSEEDSAAVIVEEQPKFPGGDQAMMEFIQKRVTYPDTARKAGYTGKVMVQFIVNKDGSLSSIRVINDEHEEFENVHKSLKEEAIRVVREMPDWEPGTQRGEPVRVQVRIPIRFKL